MRIFFGVITKFGYISFFKVKVQNWGIFWVAKISNIIWGA